MRTRHWSLPVVHDSSLRLKSRPRAADQSGRDNPFMAEADTYSRRRGFGLLDQPYLLLSMTSLFWAINTVIGRLSAGHIPPMTLACVRWGGAFIVLLPFAALPLARDWPTIRKHIGTLAVLALTGFSAYNAITYYALQYTTAINGLLMQSGAPLFVALWSFLLLGERLTWRQAGGICVSLTGVLTIISQGSLAILLGFGFNYGDPWFLVALLIYGYYMAAFRNRPPLHPVSFLAVGVGLGTLFLLPGMLWEFAQGKSFALDARNMATLGFLWVFPSTIGYLFLNRGVELIGANRAAPFIHLVPVFGSVIAVAFLGESFELYHAIGYALVCAGITVAARK
jgi:drug/metabolite transporter (DMT)-like permease